MKMISKYLIVFALICTVFACKKNSDNPTDTIIGDTLSETDNDFLESISIANPALSDMLGTDGTPLGFTKTPSSSAMRVTGTQALLDSILDRMLIKAQQLSALKSITYPDAGTNKPEHIGLVYSYGQRTIISRQNPLYGNDTHKKYGVFGTDCSGFIINLLNNVGVSIENTNVADFKGKIIEAINNNTSLKDSLDVQDLGKLSAGNIKSGDIITWITPTGNHMGILCKLNGGGICVFQSNGNGNPATESLQTKNLSLTRGVHPVNFITAIAGPGYWGTNYTILRIKKRSNTVTDINGNEYHFVTVGTQVWMTENLRVSNYNDGTIIPTGLSDIAWAADTVGAYDIYNHNAANELIYGKMYNGYAVATGKLAPTGWHVATDAEWTTLVNYLGGDAEAGGPLKATTLWQTPNGGATNSSGLSILPSGYRNANLSSVFANIALSANIWTSTGAGTQAYYRVMNYQNTNAYRIAESKKLGMAVRCVRD